MDQKVRDYIDKYGVTEETRRFLEKTPKMYIGGEWLFASSGKTISVEEPSTGAELTHIPAATVEDVDRAVAAARQAFAEGEWSDMKAAQRERILRRIADLLEQNTQTIAEIESIDAGKAITGCIAVDVAGSIDLLHYMAGWPTKIEGATRPASLEGENFAYTLKEPVGVVGAIVPWNWPLNMAIWKIAAPLAAGCTLVVKPAQLTSLSLLFFAELCEQAGLPPGVLNIVTGSGRLVGEHLARHPGVSKISFTGSTEVGRQVGKSAMDHVAHVTLELGGKSPMIAFEDADVQRIVDATQASIFFNAGQVCSAGSRLYVQESIYEEVVRAVSERANAMKHSPGLDPESEIGPVISRSQFDSICDYIEIGKQEGAEVVCGGEALDRDGYFIRPTLLGRTTNAMRVVQEEIFGPVLVVQAFKDEAEAVKLANDNEYGLAASVFTRDISRAHRVAKAMEAGTVWINTHDMVDTILPFGGYKNSGIGKDLGPEQLEHFLETKSVWLLM
ncbi:MAG: aldehyde dehydrogenase family protein [Gammaproteobacteria bacterium]|nr:aldehyde dehydrogenase family protein [Gammaproteobacteria bacterium]